MEIVINENGIKVDAEGEPREVYEIANLALNGLVNLYALTAVECTGGNIEKAQSYFVKLLNHTISECKKILDKVEDDVKTGKSVEILEKMKNRAV